jgi:hypothetical protein
VAVVVVELLAAAEVPEDLEKALFSLYLQQAIQ